MEKKLLGSFKWRWLTTDKTQRATICFNGEQHVLSEEMEQLQWDLGDCLEGNGVNTCHLNAADLILQPDLPNAFSIWLHDL